jgi:hypothetical protein
LVKTTTPKRELALKTVLELLGLEPCKAIDLKSLEKRAKAVAADLGRNSPSHSCGAAWSCVLLAEYPFAFRSTDHEFSGPGHGPIRPRLGSCFHTKRRCFGE